VLYLAEVQKKSGFMGSSKPELKLLARQQSEQSWNAILGDDLIPTDLVNDYNHGNLVLVELSTSRQVQNLQEAGKQLVVILQNFSRMKEKFRTQEEEIEGWKQSLIYQSQELTRRELELEARQDELQQLEADMQQFDQQRQELSDLRSKIEGDRQAIETSQRRLEELRASGSGAVHPEQVQQIEQLLQRLGQEISQNNDYAPLLDQHQSLLNQHWQILQQQQALADQHQSEIDGQTQALDTDLANWHQTQASLEQSQTELKIKIQVLSVQNQTLQTLNRQIEANQTLQDQLAQMTSGGEASSLPGIDSKTLTQMPLEALQSTVNNLKKDLEKIFSFVNDQEEELGFQQQSIETLQAKIQKASEYDRLGLAGDLDSEQQSYQLLDEALQGQRQRLQERQNLLKAHEAILERRLDPSTQIVVESQRILQQLAVQQQQQLQSELQTLEAEVQQGQSSLQQWQDEVSRQTQEQQARRAELRQSEQDLQQRRTILAEMWGRVNTYRDMLQPLQDDFDGIRRSLQSGAGENGAGQPGQMVAELKHLITSLRG
jgi:chromosome segregation ATPase